MIIMPLAKPLIEWIERVLMAKESLWSPQVYFYTINQISIQREEAAEVPLPTTSAGHAASMVTGKQTFHESKCDSQFEQFFDVLIFEKAHSIWQYIQGYT